MSLLVRRRAMMGAKKEEHGVPDDYQKVEWIKSDGNQYIILTPNIKRTEFEKYKISADAEISNTMSTIGMIAAITEATGCWIGALSDGQHIGLSSSIYFQGIDIYTKHKYEIDLTRGTNTYATCDGINEIIRQRKASIVGPVALFAAVRDNNASSYKCKCKMYHAEVFYNGAKIRELYPCYRKSDNVIGMYDVVTDTFYTNSGSGTFTKGADVT